VVKDRLHPLPAHARALRPLAHGLPAGMQPNPRIRPLGQRTIGASLERT
jgi:hypothetical protein